MLVLTKRKCCVTFQVNQTKLWLLSIYQGSKYLSIQNVFRGLGARINVHFAVTCHEPWCRHESHPNSSCPQWYFALITVKVSYGPQSLILLNSSYYFMLLENKLIFLVIKYNVITFVFVHWAVRKTWIRFCCIISCLKYVSTIFSRLVRTLIPP